MTPRRALASSVRALITSCVLVALWTSAAHAQPAPRVTISFDVGAQAAGTSFDDRFTFDVNRETGSAEIAYPIDPGPIVAIGAAVRLKGPLAAGIVFSHYSRDGSVSARAAVPHPFFFDTPRAVAGDADGIERRESVVHVQAVYEVPSNGRLRIALSGGPSFFSINQSIISAVTYTEEYPFDTAEFSGVEAADADGSAVGFNVGADLRWMFTPRVGIGGSVRFTRATVDLEARPSDTIGVDAGGVQVGAGLRFAF